MLSAVAGAGVIALVAAQAVPADADSLGFSMASVRSDGSARSGPDDQAARGAGRAELAERNQPAPDVWLLPARSYHVTSTYGMRWGRFHAGIDLGAPVGTPFYAVAAGRITDCRWDGGYGFAVRIDHGGGIASVYGHASRLLCREGATVRAGELIGRIGNTGRSYGPHLHFEIRRDGRPVEPTSFMLNRSVDLIAHADAVYGDIVSD